MGTFVCAAPIEPACCFVTAATATNDVTDERDAAKSCIIYPLLCVWLEAAQTYRIDYMETGVACKYAFR